jgi:hypothetical protein
MEAADISVKRILHEVNKPDVEKVGACVSLFYQLGSPESRVTMIQGLVYSCEYVHEILLLSKS